MQPSYIYFKFSGANHSQVHELYDKFGCTSASCTKREIKHPLNNRRWLAKNLRCNGCTDDCPICGAKCCRYKAESDTFADPTSSMEARAEAKSNLEKIQLWVPIGKDNKSFIQCNHGSGCGRFVCPECVGRCPTEICQDIQCRVSHVVID